MINVVKGLALLFLPIFLFGCATGGQDYSGLVKSIPDVQKLLEQYPNAEIKVSLLSADTVKQMQATIQQQCNVPLQAKDYYYVTINDASAGIAATLYIDKDTEQVACAYKEGIGASKNPGTKPDENMGYGNHDNNYSEVGESNSMSNGEKASADINAGVQVKNAEDMNANKEDENEHYGSDMNAEQAKDENAAVDVNAGVKSDMNTQADNNTVINTPTATQQTKTVVSGYSGGGY